MMKMINGKSKGVEMRNPIRDRNEFTIACAMIMGMRNPREAEEMIDWVAEQVSDWHVDEDERHAMDVMIEAVQNVIIDIEMMEVA